MSKYGEPWRACECVPECRLIRDVAGREVGAIEDRDYRRRAVACVNAMEGLNPEKLPELIRVVKVTCNALTGIDDMYHCEAARATNKLLGNALAALEDKS